MVERDAVGYGANEPVPEEIGYGATGEALLAVGYGAQLVEYADGEVEVETGATEYADGELETGATE